MNDIDRELIEEQIRYYGKRAAEYDETSEESEDPLAPQAEQLWAALDRFEPREKVLELACGTGSRTKLLLKHAREIVALDSSDEMIQLARRKVGDRRVRFIHEDVFSWTPDDRSTLFASSSGCHMCPQRGSRNSGNSFGGAWRRRVASSSQTRGLTTSGRRSSLKRQTSRSFGASCGMAVLIGS
jgi:SAM-dependent methyltransferase